MSNIVKPELKQLPIDKLVRGRFQPRKQFTEEGLQELAESIKSSGLIQPIVVRPKSDDHYEIVAGERRWRAAQLAGLDVIPCLVNKYSDEQTAAVATIENVNRIDLNPIEEAQAYQRLMEDFQYVHDEIAAVVGKSRTKITNSLRLLKLDDSIQKMLIDGLLSEGHGKVLAALSNKLQRELAQKCISYGWSVRKIEQEAKKQQLKPSTINDESDPDVVHLEKALSDHVGCNVKIDFENTKGQLKIDFHNLEILEGIMEKMGFKEQTNE
ncbi:MAG: ParB/RepB/Spo0J family partition protein [Gammaproteobacteria bacterium]